MPEYLAPGVYVEETSFRSKSIEGVSTTTTGFIGPTRYGPTDLEPDIITSLGEFERIYGDRQKLNFSDTGPIDNFMWHAVRAFFEEGGKRLYISRVFTPADGIGNIASGSPPAPAGVAALEIKARFAGAAGNVRVRFDEPRHQRQAREIDHFRVRRSFDFARRANCFDFLAMDQHHPAVMQLRGLTIEDVRGFEQIDRVGRLGLRILTVGGRRHLDG